MRERRMTTGPTRREEAREWSSINKAIPSLRKVSVPRSQFFCSQSVSQSVSIHMAEPVYEEEEEGAAGGKQEEGIVESVAGEGSGGRRTFEPWLLEYMAKVDEVIEKYGYQSWMASAPQKGNTPWERHDL